MKKNKRKIKNFTNNFSLLLNHHSLSFRKIAKAVGFTHSYLARLANGQRVNPSINVIEKIADVFKISISQLFGEQEIDFKNRPKELDLDFDEE